MTIPATSLLRLPRLGAHVSVTGGLHKAFERLASIDGQALQIFSKNQRQWKSAPLDAEAVRLFRAASAEAGHPPTAIHDSYLINLAAPSAETIEKSVAAFADELVRAEALGVPFLVTHPGAHLGDGTEAGIERFAANLDRAIAESGTSAPLVLLENTAGQGTSLGATFEELAGIIAASRHPGRLGVCFDTCHAFTAGCDLRTPEGCEATWTRFEKLLGLERLRFMHLNDSKKGFASRVDRHEHIGQGLLGLEAFRQIVNDPRLRHVPMVIETPKENDLEEDRMNLAALRALVRPEPEVGGEREPGCACVATAGSGPGAEPSA